MATRKDLVEVGFSYETGRKTYFKNGVEYTKKEAEAKSGLPTAAQNTFLNRHFGKGTYRLAAEATARNQGKKPGAVMASKTFQKTIQRLSSPYPAKGTAKRQQEWKRRVAIVKRLIGSQGRSNSQLWHLLMSPKEQ